MQLLKIFKKKKKLPTHTLEELKNRVRILFIDDKACPKATQLHEQDGWRHVQKIKDVSSISQTELQDAHIIFVDVQGVGKTMDFKDEGLGLIVAIKETYPDKKIVMYSAESQGQINAFHKAASLVDGRLRKGADLYEFSAITERLSKEAFCYENCIRHIQKVLRSDFNIEKTEEDIKKILERIYEDDLFNDTSRIAECFNLSNVGSIASIVQLFFIG